MYKLSRLMTCFLLAANFAQAQVTPSEKKNELTTATVINPCMYLPPDNFPGEVQNTVFRDLCSEVFKNKQYRMEDSVQIISLLKSVQANGDDEVCIIPFLRLIDSAADSKGDSLCIPRPWRKPGYYDGYCFLKKADFIVLFYLEFVLIRNATVSQRELIAELALQKKSAPKKELDKEDYKKLLELYTQWYMTPVAKRKGHPLDRSKFVWEYTITYKGRSFIRGDK